MIALSRCQRQEELQRSWWQEYALCSSGPGPPLQDAGTSMDLNRGAEDFLDERYAAEETTMGVPVKGGLYEVWLH